MGSLYDLIAALGPRQRAEVAGLRERLKQGRLTREKLLLAAYLGHTPARRAVGEKVVATRSIERWVQGLAPWGDPVRDQVAAAVGRLVSEGDERLTGLSTTLAEHGRCPCEAHRELVRAAVDAVVPGITDVLKDGATPRCWSAWAVCSAGWAVCATGPSREGLLVRALVTARKAGVSLRDVQRHLLVELKVLE